MKKLKLLAIIVIALLITSCSERPMPVFNCEKAFVVNKIETDGDLAIYTCYDNSAGANGKAAFLSLNPPAPSFVAPIGTYDIGDTVYVGKPIVYVHDTIYVTK